jgi:hypothetical protein
MWIQLARDWCIQCRLWLCVFQHSPTGFLGMMVPTYFSIDFCCVSMFFELYCIDMLLLYTWCHICLNMYTDNCMLYIYIYVYTRMMHVCVYIYICMHTHIHIFSSQTWTILTLAPVFKGGPTTCGLKAGNTRTSGHRFFSISDVPFCCRLANKAICPSS